MAMDMDSASTIPTELCSALQSFGEGTQSGSQTVQCKSDKNGGKKRQATAKSDGVIDITVTVQYRQPP